MYKKIKTLILSAALSVPVIANAMPTVITSVNQLDFAGDFLYAVNFNGSGSQSIGDATFTNVLASGAGAPVGVSVSGFNVNTVWSGASNLGSTADANALESILGSIIWSNGLNPGAINAAVTAGTSYRLQLLFSEGCCNNRHYDVSVENGLFSDTVVGTFYDSNSVWQTSSTQGYAMSWDFTAQDNLLNIGFTRHAPGDTNYHISGFTLERISTQVPEPASLALFGIGLAGLAARRRRR